MNEVMDSSIQEIKSKTLQVGNAELIEFDIFVHGEFEDTYCHVVFPDGYKVGGYTSINDALAHKGEWSDE